MNLDQVECFFLAAKSQTFLDAATFLGISQSSLSKQIMKLEKELGVKLFDRRKRKAVLTDYGRRLLNDAYPMMKEYKILKEKASAYQQELGQEILRIGLLPLPVTSSIYKALLDFSSYYQEINLSIKQEDETGLLSGLNQEYYDLIISRYSMMRKSRYREIFLERDELVAVVSSCHSMAGREQIRLEEMKKEAFIFMEPSTAIYRISMELCAAAGFVPDIIETAGVDDVIGKVASDRGVSLMARSVYQALENGETEAVSLRPLVKIPVTALSLRKREEKRSVRLLLEFLREVYKGRV